MIKYDTKMYVLTIHVLSKITMFRKKVAKNNDCRTLVTPRKPLSSLFLLQDIFDVKRLDLQEKTATKITTDSLKRPR